MYVLIKIFGFIFVAFSGFGYGIYKTNNLQQKMKNTEKLIIGLNNLSNDIRLNGTETQTVIKKNFSKYQILNITYCSITAKSNCFFKEDEEKINEFFSFFGNRDICGECERIENYKRYFEDRYNEISKEYKTKSKVWKTAYTSAGIAIAILII